MTIGSNRVAGSTSPRSMARAISSAAPRTAAACSLGALIMRSICAVASGVACSMFSWPNHRLALAHRSAPLMRLPLNGETLRTWMPACSTVAPAPALMPALMTSAFASTERTGAGMAAFGMALRVGASMSAVLKGLVAAVSTGWAKKAAVPPMAPASMASPTSSWPMPYCCARNSPRGFATSSCEMSAPTTFPASSAIMRALSRRSVAKFCMKATEASMGCFAR